MLRLFLMLWLYQFLAAFWLVRLLQEQAAWRRAAVEWSNYQGGC